ncbi:YeeE/YedE thiosulfate transporter family protein [Bosea psychrotolerans]|uniref:Uncharacterized protein n=1 Tax=Bosea psychrotolerans TaxID=1871628 RepID=A0A2S4LXH2_9HYPH|nr:YeeE/YedE thiosulfate transporter family protein [Bosea psychrotolerans]POR47154.1 hypothetical protein CYD53_12044 [Bosea psychrotolerans]
MVTHTSDLHYAPTLSDAVDWSPYLAGAGIGVLSWIVFAAVDQPIGITTALSQLAAGAAIPIFGSDSVSANSYWAKNPFVLDYGVIFLAGTLLGALASALLSRRFHIETVPSVWREHFGPSVAKRLTAAFLGGILTMFGARLAGGCTSGHGISGGLQLALSSWVFLAVMFPVGIATAHLTFRRRA